MARLIQAMIAERDHRDTAALTAVTAAVELARRRRSGGRSWPSVAG